MKNQKFFDLCTQELSGAISNEDKLALTKYLEEHPDQLDAFKELQQQWEISGQLRLKYKADPQLAWEKFSELKSDHESKTVRWIHFAIRLAAMVVLTVGLGFLMREFGKSEPYHYATFEGETKWITLSDSSRIRLNESSLLTVAADFNEDDRNVSLEGEAYFEIARDEARPFIIQTNEATTQVLGTAFNIRAIEEEPKVEIYVVNGKVSFTANGSELILTQGMAANFDRTSDLLSLDSEELNALAWQSKTLKFEDSPLDKVFAALQSYFKADMVITNDKIKNCRFTGEFKKPKLKEILKVISISTNVTYTEDNGRFIISGEGCAIEK
ncbi:FecR family protein [Reichenbachiella faecimaris]|uniref:FecR family protein n=1 Tax=Reichenbachiella faecimaris TaxID=692418 RepID=A0A1W2GFD4_REIFA|nr:FecR domain-containing protein [Reichenbachiella faecimaris]SMD35379.1 FecR family protein [Reichenbachiella faecimaris]